MDDHNDRFVDYESYFGSQDHLLIQSKIRNLVNDWLITGCDNLVTTINPSTCDKSRIIAMTLAGWIQQSSSRLNCSVKTCPHVFLHIQTRDAVPSIDPIGEPVSCQARGSLTQGSHDHQTSDC